MPSEHLKNNARLTCIRGLYEARSSELALREFDDLLSLTPIRSFLLFRVIIVAPDGIASEVVAASPLSVPNVAHGPVPEEWVARVLRHETGPGHTAVNNTSSAKSRKKVSASAILRLGTSGALEAAAIAVESDNPGEQAYFACLADGSLSGEALTHALEEWGWLIDIGAGLLLRHFPASMNSDDDALLTASEARVLKGLARGLSAEQIAEETGRSLSTIRNQLRSARVRLGARSTAETLAIAIRTGQIRI